MDSSLLVTGKMQLILLVRLALMIGALISLLQQLLLKGHIQPRDLGDE
jgi:hypothetical protein